MTEPRTAALTLWSRLISGETLEEVELRRLIDMTQHDPSLRKEIEADATLHALLRSMTDVRQTEDQFTRSVLERCHSLESNVGRSVEANRVESEVDTVAFEVAAADRIPRTASVNDTSPPLVASRPEQRGTNYRKRRKSSAWSAIATTVAVFACFGLIAWTQLGPLPPQTGNESTPEVVQGPNPEQPQQPEAAATNQDVASSSVEDPAVNNTALETTASPDAIASNAGDANQLPPNAMEVQTPAHAENPQMIPEVPTQAIANRPDVKSPLQFVTFTKVEDPVWERTNAIGDRLGDEIVRLFAGSVELTFDQGAVVTVDGPVEFRPLSTGQLELRRGRLLASVPQQAIGFTVSTPTSQVVDLGTEFEVAVNDEGQSDVQVLRGEIEVGPVIADGEEFQKWRLLPGKFDRASFFARPQIKGPTPMSASLRGPRGQFQGFVSLNGQTAEFSSPEAFDNVRRRAVTELARSQQTALRQWKEFVDSMQKNMQGTMNFNGQEMPFGSLQDVMRMQRQMLENVQKAGGNSGKPNFTGSINVNGKVITFKTREEYEAARQTAFGPAATFGIGDVFEEDRTSR